MESKDITAPVWADSDKLKTLLVYEALGTAVVTYAFTLSAFNPLIRALAYFIVYLMCAHITGAHCNPAVSFACHLMDRTEYRT
jgi:glycerol uptake facilitator-like aquaporin